MSHKLLLDLSRWGQFWKSYTKNNNLSISSVDAYIQFKDAAGIIDTGFINDDKHVIIFENEEYLIEFKMRYL
jgi:hypothetical protein